MQPVLNFSYASGYVGFKSDLPSSEQTHKLHSCLVKNTVSLFKRARNSFFCLQLKVLIDTLKIDIPTVNVVIIITTVH